MAANPRMRTRMRMAAALVVCMAIAGLWAVRAASAGDPGAKPTTAPSTRPVEPKPLSENVKKGLDWLARNQLESGAWGQGDESSNMRQSPASTAPAAQGGSGVGNVADTCAGMLAFLRAGSTPTAGPHASHLLKAADYLCTQVERADTPSLFITDARGTRLQGKLGTYIDTFMAALVLAELKDRMPDAASNKRVLAALDKTMDKIERNQRPDGGWAGEGWAPALAQGVASKAVNVAAQRGGKVNEDVRKRAERYAAANFDAGTGAVAGGGSAGVELYARSSNLQALKDSDVTNQARVPQLQAVIAAPTTSPAARAAAESELADIRQNSDKLQAATQAAVGRLGDAQFVAGFGSNGGEEFLSYMNIGESLVSHGGGEEWAKWDKQMTENLNRIQNDDGSWSGHHCITGKTFCTSAALLTLMVDRTTKSLTEQMKKR